MHATFYERCCEHIVLMLVDCPRHNLATEQVDVHVKVVEFAADCAAQVGDVP
jgi:hypothetical protein